MPSSKITAHALRDVKFSAAMIEAQRKANWSFDRMQQIEPWRTHFISFVSLAYHKPSGKLYCGLTSLAQQVFYAFDPQTKKFEDLYFEKQPFADRFDIKIHRSFEWDDDGTLISATAHLHDYGQSPEAPGGKLFRFDPATKKYEFLGIPVPYTGIQTIALDARRDIVYGNCYPLNECFAWDIKKRQRLPFKWGFHNHKARCDKEGNYWGISETERDPIEGVNEEQARILKTCFNMPASAGKLFKYNPDDGYQVLDQGLPLFSGHEQSFANAIDGGDGFMYIGTNWGALYRVGKKSGKLESLGVPSVGGRLEGLGIGPDGLLYLAGGTFYLTRVFALDRDTKKLYDFGPIFDPRRNERCIIVHAMQVADDGTIYIGETDNMERSGYLWECKVKK